MGQRTGFKVKQDKTTRGWASSTLNWLNDIFWSSVYLSFKESVSMTKTVYRKMRLSLKNCLIMYVFSKCFIRHVSIMYGCLISALVGIFTVLFKNWLQVVTQISHSYSFLYNFLLHTKEKNMNCYKYVISWCNSTCILSAYLYIF